MKKIVKDNRGFTLAELLIAIAILAIVLTPLAHNFVESARINTKARTIMNATNMASNIAEGLSAYSAEDIVIAFDSHSISGNGLKILPADITCTTHGELVPGGAPGSWSLGYSLNGDTVVNAGITPLYVNGGSVKPNELDFVAQSDGKYYLYAAGVQQKNTVYDMMISLDASADSTFSGDLNGDGKIDGYVGGVAETERYNDYKEVVITQVNGLVDSVYRDSTTSWEDARAIAISKATNGATISQTDFENDYARKIVLNIDKTTDAEGDKISVKVHNEYSFDGWWTSLNVEAQAFATVPEQINYVPTQYPRNIYIYYYPNYNDGNATTGKGNPSDTFVINNNTDIDVSVHLVRLLPGDISEATLSSYEASYKTGIYLNDNVDSEVHTHIYSNLKDNLTATEADNVSIYRKDNARCTLYLNGGGAMYASQPMYQQILDENGAMVTTVRDRLYAVEIKVYENGAAAVGFPDDMLLATYSDASAKQ